MSPSRLLLLIALPLALASCGGKAEPRPALVPVILTVDAPADTATVAGGTVEVRGSVRPAGARVLVGGAEAATSGGAFSAVVALEPGVNVVDVIAGAPRREAAMTALRVVREVRVKVPDVGGMSTDDAVAELERQGLRADVQRRGGLLDKILPGSPEACSTEPGAGARVRHGATVTVLVSKTC